MLIPVVPRLFFLVLVSLQTHSILFLRLALGLVNAFILEDTLILIVLSDVSLEVSQLLRTLEKPTSFSKKEKSNEEKVTFSSRTPTTSRIFFLFKNL